MANDSLAWPDPISRRGFIASSISALHAYTASDKEAFHMGHLRILLMIKPLRKIGSGHTRLSFAVQVCILFNQTSVQC